MANTRKVLERLPDDKFAWKAHEKSMSIGQMAAHLSHIPSWGVPTIELRVLDLTPVGGEPYTQPKVENRADAIKYFDAGVAKFRALLADVSDASLMESWTMQMAGNPILTMPRVAVIRSMILNHMIHHRAQLTVYYRLNDIPVPSLYGPSADEK